MEWTAGAWPGAPGPGEAHVWKTGLDVDCASFDAALMLLSADERVRAARFRFERDRNRFVAGRAFLRTLLGNYLGATPGELVFTTNEFGKPSIAGAGIRSW